MSSGALPTTCLHRGRIGWRRPGWRIRAQTASRGRCWRCHGHWPRTLARQMRHWAKPWSKVESGIFPRRRVYVNNIEQSCILTKGVGPPVCPPWGLASGSGFGMSCCQKTPDMQAARPAKEHHRAEVRQKGSQKSSETSANKAWRSMCTVEDKTGIPLPGCAIGSRRARWA